MAQKMVGHLLVSALGGQLLEGPPCLDSMGPQFGHIWSMLGLIESVLGALGSARRLVWTLPAGPNEP